MSIKIKQRRPYLVKEVGEWKFTFHYKEGSIEKTFLSITSTSGIMNIHLGGNTHAFGYLLAAAKQGLDNQLAGYATTLYIPAMSLTQDQGLCNDCQKSIMKWQKRKMREGAENAKKVTDAEEMASDALMREAIDRGKPMSRQQRRKMERESRKEMREILKEDSDGE